MKKLLAYLVSSIINHQEELLITETEEGDYLNLIIKVHPDDLKILIGKSGQTIRAIREIVKIKALTERKKVNIKIKE